MPPRPPSPLEDPTYDPVHKPADGQVPYVVEKWGPRSQLRWFDRFRSELRPQRAEYWARFYCSSLQHRGQHCPSCLDDEWDGYRDWDPDRCCCRAYRAEDSR
jgi:hypothetical protein